MENKDKLRTQTSSLLDSFQAISPMNSLPLSSPLSSSSSSACSSSLLNDHYFQNEQSIYKRDRREFVCGWGAAFINICITFPINKVMFRQMAYGVNASSAMNQLKGESLLYIYRGLLPPLISKTIAVSLMFGSYHEYQQFLYYHAKLKHRNINLTLAALLAGCTEAILTPFERVQMMLQHKTFDSTYPNSWKAFSELRQFGLKEYYRGLTPILLRNGPSNVIYFYSRAKVKEQCAESDQWYLNVAQDFISGALIGALTSTFFYPINVIRTKMQTVKPGEPHLSMIQAARMVYSERDRSVRKLFYGVNVNFSRALLSWGIITASYEFLKKHLFI